VCTYDGYSTISLLVLSSSIGKCKRTRTRTRTLTTAQQRASRGNTQDLGGRRSRQITEESEQNDDTGREGGEEAQLHAVVVARRALAVLQFCYSSFVGRYFTQGGRVFDAEGITIEGGREKKEEKRGRGGEKEHLQFVSIAYFASSL
jgi:hypothetical protein